MRKIATLKLLQQYSKIINELKNRKVLRTTNNPVADYAEYLVATKLNLELAHNSKKSFDATDLKTGKRYQIKSRRLTGNKKSLQLGIMRSLDFDFLIVAILNEDFTIFAIYQIPQNVIPFYAKWSDYQKGYILVLNDKVLKDKRLKQLTL